MGYKHTDEAKLKISKPGKLNPMYGKSHSDDTKVKMSEKKISILSLRRPCRLGLLRRSEGVGIFYLQGNLVAKFKNNVELANHLNISKVTVPCGTPLGVLKGPPIIPYYLGSRGIMGVGKYLNSNLVYMKTYYFRPITG